MKKYLIPEMDIELFDGQDLFSHSTICEVGDVTGCACETGYDPDPQECPGQDVGFAPSCPAEWGGGPEIFD